MGVGSTVIGTPLPNTELDVQPSHGNMITSKFRAQARGWTSYQSNKPVLFRFGYKVTPSADVRYG